MNKPTVEGKAELVSRLRATPRIPLKTDKVTLKRPEESSTTGQVTDRRSVTYTQGLRGRRPFNMPVLRDTNNKPLPRYVSEKALGIRRENGAMKLKSLRHKHLCIIGMHLQGMSLEGVALRMRCTVSTVSRILNDPLAQAILKRIYTDRQSEVEALGGKAVDVVRQALIGDHTINTKLRAVDKYAKIREVMLDKGRGSETAEDVIARMLAGGNIVGEQNVQINIGK